MCAVPAFVTYFDPQPEPAELPARFPSPFAPGLPVPIARRAAAALVAELRRGVLAGGVDLRGLDQPGGGKMFGVLVVAAPDGRVGYLRAFSGMLAGRWDLAGFAPPLFEQPARDEFWPAGEAELRAIEDQRQALFDGAEPVALRDALAALTTRHDRAAAAVRARHHDNKRRRHQARAALGAVAAEHAADLHALAQASRADTAEARRLEAGHHAEREAIAAPLRALEAQRAALDQRRAERSRHYLHRIHDTYVITSARGERRSLRALFAPDEPPGGAGDCAAPKLLALAYRHGLRPVALAELWWGAPPVTGGRHAGSFYPACRGKCGGVLPFMLEGLAAEPAPVFGAAPIGADEPRVVFEDPWLVVVDKPCGLLSVPGRHAQLRDSVLVRLRERYPDATGPLIVHRLDLDTSGLLLAAKDADTHAALQRQFARREVDKRYAAWLAGPVAGDAGVIELALRVDLDDRPRQIHDPVHGKAARTEWRVIGRTADRTRVALVPRTGRTHQLRVHAAHALGLGTPIVGDRLYGRADGDAGGDGADRLLLHAEALAFLHPRTGARIELERPAPF